jgi:hypothetical protein
MYFILGSVCHLVAVDRDTFAAGFASMRAMSEQLSFNEVTTLLVSIVLETCSVWRPALLSRVRMAQ